MVSDLLLEEEKEETLFAINNGKLPSEATAHQSLLPKKEKNYIHNKKYT